MVQGKYGQKPGNATIAVPERMDAQKIKDETGNRIKRRVFGLINAVAIKHTGLFNGFWCFVRRSGFIDYLHRSIRIFSYDLIIFLFPFSGISSFTAGQTMKFKNDLRRNLDTSMLPMDPIQSFSIAGNFFFRSVPRAGMTNNQRFKTGAINRYTLNTIGRF